MTWLFGELELLERRIHLQEEMYPISTSYLLSTIGDRWCYAEACHWTKILLQLNRLWWENCISSIMLQFWNCVSEHEPSGLPTWKTLSYFLWQEANESIITPLGCNVCQFQINSYLVVEKLCDSILFSCLLTQHSDSYLTVNWWLIMIDDNCIFSTKS